MLNPGQLVDGKYRIVRLIGDGGMGAVYEAEHALLGRRVALKFLHPELADKEHLKQRFLQEARVSATIRNPHIVQVSDVGTAEDGVPYLVMELLEGETLQNVLERTTKLTARDTLSLTLQILEGLAAAHVRNVIHRDLKPDNVFLTKAPWGWLPKLLDFGIAKLRQIEAYEITLTRPGAVMGTPEYMAPEQAYSADQVDERSDIYSLGVMMFQMLSGYLPAEGDTPQEIAEQIIKGKARDLATLCPHLDGELLAVVRRATAPRPEARFPDVDHLRQQLQPIADRFGVEWQRLSVFEAPPTGEAVAIPSSIPIAFDTTQEVKARVTEIQDGPSPKTVPPETQEAPRVSRLPAGAESFTAAMPRTGTAAFTPPAAAVGSTDPGPVVPASPTLMRARRARTSHRGLIASLLLATAGLGTALGVYYYYEQYLPSTWPAPPAQPTRRVVAPPKTVTLPDESPDDNESLSEQPSEGRYSAPTPGEGKRPPANDPPELRFPQLPDSLASAIPTALPTALPPGFPTAIPTQFPSIPGLTVPAPTPTTTPAPSSQ